MSKGKLNTPPIPVFRDLMDETGTKREDIAKALGVSSVAIGQYYNGETLPSIENLIKIADYFNVSTDYLLGRTDIKTTDTTIKGICEYTGFSEDFIEIAMAYCEGKTFGKISMWDIIEEIIMDHRFYDLIKDVEWLKSCYEYLEELSSETMHKTMKRLESSAIIEVENEYSKDTRREIEEKTGSKFNVVVSDREALDVIKHKIGDEMIYIATGVAREDIRKRQRGEK